MLRRLFSSAAVNQTVRFSSMGYIWMRVDVARCPIQIKRS